MKPNKAAGPDEVIVELFQIMDDDNKQPIFDTIREWWTTHDIPDTMLQALVASLYKKGDPRNLENYRPISLLNALYKIIAGILQTRIEEGVDYELQATQFGFRRSRSTSQAIYLIRRIQDHAERSKCPTFLTFLDWEKAFDRIHHCKLLEALRRMRIDPHLVALVESLYRNPTFAVKIKGITSDHRAQERGIRQGCPLSPYLFLIVMAVMFDDIHLHCDRSIAFHLAPGVTFSEVLYADDTVLVTDNCRAMNILVKFI